MFRNFIKYSVTISFLALAAPNIAFAMHPACGPTATDPDNDGWGWENGETCVFGALAPATPQCVSPDADLDGDGWGWENGDSCIVPVASVVPTGTATPTCTAPNADVDGDGWGFENGNSCLAPGFQPGIGITTPIQLDTAFGATITGLDTHNYSFDVANPVAISIDTDFIFGNSLEVRISDDAASTVPGFDYYQPAPACLAPGSYTLSVSRIYIDTSNTLDYSVTLRSLAATCVTPVTTIQNSSYGEYILDDNGNIFQTGIDNNGKSFFEKIDPTGATEWTLTTDDSSYFYPVTGTDDGSTLAAGSSEIIKADPQGQIVWRVPIANGTYVNDLIIGKDSVILSVDSNSVKSINLSDGSDRWIYTGDEYISQIAYRSDGFYVVSYYDKVVVLQE